MRKRKSPIIPLGDFAKVQAADEEKGFYENPLIPWWIKVARAFNPTPRTQTCAATWCKLCGRKHSKLEACEVLWQLEDLTRPPTKENDRGEQILNRKVGYYLNGNNITVSPYYMAPRGPWRLAYIPKAPQFGPAVDVLAGDSVVASSGTWTFANGKFDATMVGSTFVVSGPANAGNNGSFVILTVTSPRVFTTATTGLVNETFASSAIAASVQLTATVSPYRAASIVTLDQTMDTYDEIPELWAAYRILDKKKQLSLSDVPALLEAAWARVDAMAAGRQSEPVASPVLWRPSWDGVGGYGGDFGGNF